MSGKPSRKEEKSTNGRTQIVIPPGVRLSAAILGRLAPGLTARLASHLFCRPRRARVAPSAASIMQSAHPFRLKLRTHTLAAWSWGDGPTVLLHHGWGGRASQLAAFVPTLVASGYSVIAYDAPAHGDTPGTTTHGNEMARLMVEASHKLGGFDAVLAHSVGGAVSMMALRRGLRARRLILLSPPADMRAFAASFAEHLGLSSAIRGRFEDELRARIGLEWEQMHARDWARAATTPLLIFHDHRDPLVPWEHGAALSRIWPRARLVSTRDLGHRRIREDPWIIAEAVKFLNADESDLFADAQHDRPRDASVAKAL